MNYLENVQKAINYIENDLGANLDLNRIADEAVMSLPHLYRMFYSLTGHPIKDYIRKRRMSVASEHLKNSTSSLWDIALEIGFESQASFSKTFKKIVGISPGLYRKTEWYYCFERINLFEKLNYLENKELCERYADVKVIRLLSMKVLTYRYISEHSEGLERKALQMLQNIVKQLDWDSGKIRYFGYNIESVLDYSYEIIIPVDEDFKPSDFKHTFEHNDIKLEQFPGGLYAVGVTTQINDNEIISSWNRLLSEWLPKSRFTKGSHTYLEEFLHYNDKVVRMKLYLPIEREMEPNMIKIVDIVPFSVVYYREYGAYADKKADVNLTRWLEINYFPRNTVDCRLYFSYYYGSGNDEENWHEYGISLEQELVTKDDNVQVKNIGGGEYARLVTKAYGSLTGVLEVMHRWMVGYADYLLDEKRQWFAEYQLSSYHGRDEEIAVICYIPVIQKDIKKYANKIVQ